MPKYQNKCPQHNELDLYQGCSFNCIYCISHDKSVQPPLLPINKIRGLIDNQNNGRPYYLSPWTDAYQHAEEEKQYTRGIIEALSAKNLPFFVITKSTLVKRDIRFFQNKQNAFIAISLNTLNVDITKLFEPGAPSASERKLLIKELVADKSVKVVVKIDPIIPGVTDGELLTELLEWLSMVKPTAVTAETLRLSNKIIQELNIHLDKSLIDSILQHYPKVYHQPVHPDLTYRMKVLSKVAERMKRAGVKASFCQVSLPEKITEFDCRGGYNYDY